MTGGVLNVEVPTEGLQAVRVQISNGLGQRVLTLERTAEAGKDLRLPVGSLRKGVYVTTVVTESGRSVVKFVVRLVACCINRKGQPCDRPFRFMRLFCPFPSS